jgi:hypothetical protein
MNTNSKLMKSEKVKLSARICILDRETRSKHVSSSPILKV